MLKEVQKTALFPVRHHSPRSTHVLARFLDHHRPRLVLIEGPSDATHLIEVLTDEATIPPVAILAYRTDGKPESALWPFAAYSPEHAALVWAKKNGARAEFIDIPAANGLTAPRERRKGHPEIDPSAHAADRSGFRSFEEFWEASFEAPDYDADSFRAALIAYADLIRDTYGRSLDRVRDAYMVQKIAAAISGGLSPQEIAVVAGAAHIAAFVAGDVDLSIAADLPKAVPIAHTVVPYSFPRLAEQTGYGAGNRAPQYYQRAHDAGCDFRRATLEVLVEFTEHLRLRGFSASLADTIEAYRLAVALADLRGKAEPGLDELREATISTLCRGQASHVDSFLWPSVVGRRVGKVAARVGQNSLQEEFWREVKTRKLPENDEPESFVLRLSNEVEIGTSIFLHRLRIAEIPYANFAGREKLAPNQSVDELEDAGGHAALARAREAWEAQWTPATDVSLVEKIVLGESLLAVSERLLQQLLTAATTTGEAAHALMEAVVASAPSSISAALTRCDLLSCTDDDLYSLARAAHALSYLATYGTSRAKTEIGDEALSPLLLRSFDRAVLRIEASCTVDQEGAKPIKEALRTLHEVATTQKRVDGEAYFSAAKLLIENWNSNAELSGIAAGLCYLSRHISEEEIQEIVARRLSSLSEPEKAAGFLAGLLEVNALILVKNRPIVAALDNYLATIPKDRFTDVLPVLRRAFTGLGNTERRYLLENIIFLRNLGGESQEARKLVEERDREKLKNMSEEIAAAMDALDDIL
jgi:hypothetical protein